MSRLLFSSVAGAALLALAAYSPSAYSGVADRATQADVGSIHVIVYPMEVKGMVTVAGAIPLGHAFDPASGVNPVVPGLMGELLSAGTLKQDKFAIANQLDQMGATIGFRASGQMLHVSARCLKEDLPKVLKLMAEQLRSPRFAPNEVQQAKAMLQGSLMQSMQDTSARAAEKAMGAVFSPKSANYPTPTPEAAQALAKVTPADIAAFHKKYVGPAHMALVFTGDVDAQAIQAEVGKSFAGWQGGMDYARGKLPPQTPAERMIRVPMADKANVTVMVAQGTGLMTTDADYLPLQLGSAILGEGFSGRLMSTVRDQEGLTYGIGSQISGSEFTDGVLAVQATFAPQLLAQGKASTEREIKKWYEGGVTAEELAARKTSFIGRTEVSLGTTAAMAGTILSYYQRGKPLTELDQFAERVHAVTQAQVNAAIKNHLDPQKMVWVEAGTLPQ